ncbi:PAP fibrillin [Planktothrix tepida]|uniref:PAP fibrillin n=2 Tax=Planktothrix TaxID=54304 RepID=A0A1J1LS60_9CYAN|nr:MULTISPECIES: PAP/fibrillin family protein [Planktothrix]CAD5945060.1 PAP fibrillin [Planktothrix pseudagardhii]CAD5965735.1 PAP fibrillin [Planktothrix tepida]CUR35030.1 PAP fibrillin [Planktothrix tepida PCC 9214]
MMLTQTNLKQQLMTKIETVQSQLGRIDGSPATNLKIKPDLAEEIETMVVQLEAKNPNYRPLLYNPLLLNGSWLLLYSTAREIRSLASLPLGLKVGKIYQMIDVESRQFFNQAFVRHPLGLISGYVKVTATFEPVIDDNKLPNNRLNVFFQQRYIAISNIIGVKTPQLEPARVVPARNPVGRIPSLEITYLDETFRIGRGGDGSLFVLRKSELE